MASDLHSTLDWKALFRVPGFPFFFFAMFVSLFGTGMNFAGVTWYVLGATHSTVSVSLIVILVTLPGLVVPPFGGVLIDRVDRRYLGIVIDAMRAVIVLGTAALAYAGHLAMWQLYAMVLLLGVGFGYGGAGRAGILGIDGTTYLISSICLLLLRQGYYAPREIQNIRLVSASPTIEAPPEMSEPPLMRTDGAGRGASGVFADIADGLAYLREQS